MTAAIWGISLLWAIVFIYGIAGSIDFGAGFWAMVFFKEEHASAATIANRYLSPLWEVTNVFLVLFSVSLVGLFPTAAFVFGNILLVPGCLILIFLTLRTVFMVYAHSIDRYQQPLRVISGITGVIIPALLMSVFPIAQGNFLIQNNGRLTLSLTQLFSSPTTYVYILLGLTSELFLSAMLLADYSRIANDSTAFYLYRKQAIWLGPINMVWAFIAFFWIAQSAPWLEKDMLSQWPWFLVSGGFFVLGYLLTVSTRENLHLRFRLAVVSHVVQYGCAMIGYGRAHLPYLIYPYVTIQDSFTNSEMFRALIVVLILGIAILFPGFIWFWRLFLENRAYVSKED